MRVRLACWVALVAAIATLNYAARFTGGNSSSSSRDAVYSWSTFANGMVVYAFWLGLVLAIAIDRWDLLALRRPRVVGASRRPRVDARCSRSTSSRRSSR